ncbi:hypothetical protein G9A89_004353 [Geosiphon pyriformis]|nr:hypothetical protein G9A89_004353 [Geosiphon pyriformis]
MATEAWEEIREWEFEEDVELAQRITVHAIPNPANSREEEEEGDEYQFIQTFKVPTYAAAAKWGTILSVSPNHQDARTLAYSAILSKNKKATRRVVAPANKLVANKSTSSAVEDEVFDDFSSGSNIVSPGTRSKARRTNSVLHKLQAKRLQSQLASERDLALWENTARGDTNRDLEFVRSKIFKKATKVTKGDKKERKGMQKMRVEI